MKKEAAARKQVKALLRKIISEHDTVKPERTSTQVQKPAAEKPTQKPPAASIPAAISPGHAMPYIDRGKPIPDTYGRDTLRI